MFKFKPEGYESAQRRINAFWNFEETDRPLLWVTYKKPGYVPLPEKTYSSMADRWLDFDWRITEIIHNMENTVFFADSMPVSYPNLGPEIISAMAGCPYHFGKTTTWTDPCILDWEKDGDKCKIDMDSFYFKKLDEYARLLIERSEGRFIVGVSDFHPGGDHVAALRDPQTLATDLYDYPNEVKSKLAASYDEYFPVYDHFVSMIKNAGMPVASWIPLTAESSMCIPSNDFSYMISNAMFIEFFLDGLIEEMRHYKNNVYHLDGPNALRHLDTLLSLKELNAIQWVFGAGREPVAPWIDVFKKIIAAGKSVMAYPQTKNDIQLLKDNLPARGLCLMMGAKDAGEAGDILNEVRQWPVRRR